MSAILLSQSQYVNNKFPYHDQCQWFAQIIFTHCPSGSNQTLLNYIFICSNRFTGSVAGMNMKHQSCGICEVNCSMPPGGSFRSLCPCLMVITRQVTYSASQETYTVWVCCVLLQMSITQVYPYFSGLFHWHCGNHRVAPVPVSSPEE